MIDKGKLYVLFVYASLLAFTIVTTLSLMMMRPPEWGVFVYEKNHYIRIFEIAMGLNASIATAFLLTDVISRWWDEEKLEKIMGRQINDLRRIDEEVRS